jgi:hypothetical protein
MSAGDSLRILIDSLQSFVAQIPNSDKFVIRGQHEHAAAAHALALRTPLPPSPTPSEEAQYHCLDLLLSKLLTGFLPYYALKQRWQELSFEGPDIEVQKR